MAQWDYRSHGETYGFPSAKFLGCPTTGAVVDGRPSSVAVNFAIHRVRAAPPITHTLFWPLSAGPRTQAHVGEPDTPDGGAPTR